MPNFTAGTSFTDGVTNDVTALKLNALVADAVPTSSLALTSTNGTIANFTSSTANITLGTIPTLTAGTTTGTAGIFTSGTITTGLIPTLTTGTTTGTAGIFTSGTITTGVIPTGTFGTTTSTAATITTGTIPNLTTGTTTSTNEVVTNGTITNLSATTSTFLGTITGSTNVVNIGSGQIYKDASGNVGIGIASPATQLQINSSAATYSDQLRIRNTNFGNADIGVGSGIMAIATDMANIAFYTSSNLGTTGSSVPSNERLRIASAGQIGIGGANYGTSGQVLTSGGASAAPSWTAISPTPADGSITLAKLSTSATEADNVASRVAKAWVNFNGSTGAINGGDFNVSTVADNATGNFTVNFSSALSTANFASSISISRMTGGEGCCCCVASTTTGSATVNFYTSYIPGKDNAYAQDVTTAHFICFA